MRREDGSRGTSLASTPRYPAAVPGWMPQIKHLDASTAAIHEWVGYWVAKQLGRFDPVVSDSSEASA